MKFLIMLSLFYPMQTLMAADLKKPVPICTQLQTAIRRGTPTQRLNKFFSVQWAYFLTEYPEMATSVGAPGQNDRWNDRSLATLERHKQENKCQLEVLNKIDSSKLHGEDKISFDLARTQLQTSIEGDAFDGQYLVLDHLSGLQLDLPDTLLNTPTSRKKDYEDMIARLEKVPQVEAEVQELLRLGLQKHITALKMFLSRVPTQFDRVLTAKIEDSPLYLPFKDIKSPINDDEKKALQDRAKEVIEGITYPALRKLRDFVVTEYIPGSREDVAWTHMPNGKAWYAYLVKYHTTTNLTPEELHDLGLREVARLKGEMEKLKGEVHFHGDLQAFNKMMLTDKDFTFSDSASLLTGYRDIAKRIDPELPRLFKTLPRLTYGVREMPTYKSAEAPAAYYEGGSLDSGRAGYFDANTSNLPDRYKWQMEALTLHEAVPGHHLQIALASELKELPEFRKWGGYTAYVEGWGLYAETLGYELGMYKDPYSRYGQLTYEAWRAVRLVVDTGIHSLGWTRDQAIDYFKSVLPKAPSEIAIEVDRYITWPGQALAYKVGQLKFRELREKATAELGDQFNVREFHDEILRHGSLPMNVVQDNFITWLRAKKHGVNVK